MHIQKDANNKKNSPELKLFTITHINVYIISYEPFRTTNKV